MKSSSSSPPTCHIRSRVKVSTPSDGVAEFLTWSTPSTNSSWAAMAPAPQTNWQQIRVNNRISGIREVDCVEPTDADVNGMLDSS